MAKKGGNFIEQHIEKLVLVITAIACIYPMYRFVLSSPRVFKVNGRELRAGQVDIYISDKAEQLRQQLNREPDKRDYNEPCSPVFISNLAGNWHVDTKITWPVPYPVEQKIEKRYRIPVIGGVKNVTAEHIRAAAYIPKAELTPQTANQEDSYEVNDLDLITVQAELDAAGIVSSFADCFSGKNVPEQWRDATLAKPVFAAVQLERQRQDSEGKWGEWEEVPRARTDISREEYRVIEEVNSLPAGGVMIRRLKLGSKQMQTGLLQPEPYQIASAEETWLPPVLHRKYLTIQREKESQERREALAAGKEQQQPDERQSRNVDRSRPESGGRTDDRDRSRTTERDTRTRSTRETGGGGGIAGRSGEPADRSGGASRSTVRPARPERQPVTGPTPANEPSRAVKQAVDTELYNEFKKMLLTDKDITTVSENVTLWAHDDTAEPGSTYRYRLRVGVFNPVAGTGQVYADDISYNNKVILWGDYSAVTEAITIPKRIYFFPVSVQEAARAADVQVCKYTMGYWYSEQFSVKRGEVIGKVAKVSQPKQQEQTPRLMMEDTERAAAELPEMIDYTTGAVLVDLVAVNDWSGSKNLQQRQYFDMLYSPDGMIIEKLASKLMYWPDDVRARYSEIKALEKRPRVAFQQFSNSGAYGDIRQRGTPTRTAPGRGYDDQRMMMEEMMRMRMGQP
jgi:hypothetical protein